MCLKADLAYYKVQPNGSAGIKSAALLLSTHVFLDSHLIFLLWYLHWVPWHKLEFQVSILKTRIIRGLSPVSYKIQSVSATLAFTANLDLKPTGEKLSVRQPIFSETHVQFLGISQWIWVRAEPSQQPGLFVR